MTETEDKINTAIDNANFNFFELEGFKAKPRLALLAGAAIGYRLGFEEIERLLTPEMESKQAKTEVKDCGHIIKVDDCPNCCGVELSR